MDKAHEEMHKEALKRKAEKESYIKQKIEDLPSMRSLSKGNNCIDIHIIPSLIKIIVYTYYYSYIFEKCYILCFLILNYQLLQDRSVVEVINSYCYTFMMSKYNKVVVTPIHQN